MTAVEFLPAAVAAMNAAIDRDQAAKWSHLPYPLQVRYRMSPNGTAGRCVAWLTVIAESNPDRTPSELVEQLAERCDREVAERPGFYTPRHMLRMIELAGRTADVIEWNRR